MFMPEKVEYLDVTDIENMGFHNDDNAQFYDDDDQEQTDE